MSLGGPSGTYTTIPSISFVMVTWHASLELHGVKEGDNVGERLVGACTGAVDQGFTTQLPVYLRVGHVFGKRVLAKEV